jgi:propionyl-CoA synthetase
MSTYRQVHAYSLADRDGFWGEAAQGIDWTRTWDKVLDDSSAPFYHWFAGGQLNTCYNAVDRHVEQGHGDRTAIIYDSPVTDSQRRISYAELQDLVARFAGVLAAQGVAKGDRVIVYMPMVPEAAIAMLACARLGAVHSVVFGGFAPNELATRIDDAKPKVIVSASCGVEVNRVIPYKPLLDSAIEIATHKPSRTVMLQRPMAEADLIAGRDLDWREAMEGAAPHDCVTVAATDPLYILYTSGTTGQPKGIVRDNGGHAVALEWSMKNIYGVEPGEVYWAASDVGWVVGAGRHPRPGRLLAGDRRAQRIGHVHRADGLPRHPPARPGGRVHRQVRPFPLPRAFSGWRALRSGHAPLGRGKAGRSRHRSLVADRNRLGHRGELHRDRAASGQGRIADLRGAGVGP